MRPVSAVMMADAAANEDLVQRACRGDLNAYAVLADRHGPMAYRVALRLLGHHQDAEDVAQEALVTAWQQLPEFRPEASFSTWLCRILVHRALNQVFRAQAAASFDPLGDAMSSVAEPAPEAEHSRTVDPVTAAVAALPPSQRVVIVLHHFEGLPDQEIAHITGSTCPAVRSHLFRGRRTLAKTLQDWKLQDWNERPGRSQPRGRPGDWSPAQVPPPAAHRNQLTATRREK